MVSPPTPSAESPTNRDEWRFRPLTTPTEWIEDYRPGKYHPVHFGDTFNEARYRVVRKLGYGSFSTVWLAKDQELQRYVALKIMVANPNVCTYEVSILEALSQATSEGPGRSHVMTMDDFFEHEGPNGVHRCLVFEVMGPSVATCLEELPDSAVIQSGLGRRYPVWMAKPILHQALLGIEFLHRNGVAHGDLQQGNILFLIKDLSSVGEKELSEDNQTSDPVQRVDGRTDRWAPQYLALDRSLSKYVDVSPGFKIKIADLGGAFMVSNPPDTLVTPVALRSPELVFEGKVNQDQDIWSFGCLIFELFIGRHLFLVGGEIIKNYIGDLVEGFDPNEIEPMPPLEQQFDQGKPDDLSDEEAGVIKGLLRWILDYDAAKRPSASELLQHPWFSAMEGAD